MIFITIISAFVLILSAFFIGYSFGFESGSKDRREHSRDHVRN